MHLDFYGTRLLDARGKKIFFQNFSSKDSFFLSLFQKKSIFCKKNIFFPKKKFFHKIFKFFFQKQFF